MALTLAIEPNILDVFFLLGSWSCVKMCQFFFHRYVNQQTIFIFSNPSFPFIFFKTHRRLTVKSSQLISSNIAKTYRHLMFGTKGLCANHRLITKKNRPPYLGCVTKQSRERELKVDCRNLQPLNSAFFPQNFDWKNQQLMVRSLWPLNH
jgi:hypothetical protein